ncbi:hypothetical protein FE257_002212 [Aspergillus nanangensis]|uniref:Large ribosomal subunit protein bL34m n=1 Tax=Aspergillus nanangensis TaxID=2582783 RepID=A0AAD4CCW4_ASPNN|nr:hypothetical protein FE257_002212 [Aspergillus nanangensis]
MLGLRCSRSLPSTLRTLSSSSSSSSFSSPITTSITRAVLSKQMVSTTAISPFRTLSTTTLSAFRPQQPQSALSSLRPQLPSCQSTNAFALQARSFSASASLGGKRSTYNPSRRVQKRRHGFLARMRTRGGRIVLMRRRVKGRKALSW